MTEPALPPLTETRKGLYKHYKGKLYEVIGTARHSETLEAMTVYRALYDSKDLWVRPAAMFAEKVNVNGELKPRFAWMNQNDRD